MNFINSNLKKIGIFNGVLIIIAIIFKLYALLLNPNFITIIDAVFCIASLAFGFVYGLNGYIKDVANYFKLFFVLYGLSTIFSTICSYIYKNDISNTIFVLSLIVHALIALYCFTVAFVKNIGKERSIGLSFVNVVLSSFILMIGFATKNNIQAYVAIFSNLLLACVACVFVNAKYRDKDARGTK